MSTPALISRVNRSLALGALLSFAMLGTFGHSLHALLPCSDGACGASVEEKSCCCGHAHAPVASAIEATAAETGPQVKAVGHDAESCPLCTLLAKIKVGRPALFHAPVETAHDAPVVALGESLLSHDLALSGAPRGPPLA